MKRVFRIAGAVIGFAVLPMIGYAAFTGTCTKSGGTAAGSSPSDCNVPGVIWNVKGVVPTPAPQDAEININGKAAVGTTGGLNTLKGSTQLESGASFQVNNGGASSVYDFRNWDGVSYKPFTLNVNGGFTVQSIPPYGPTLGQDGRIQADKFCFNPGGGADCITSWPGGGGGGGGGTGNYVSKNGDTMDGTLNISSSTFGMRGLDVDTLGGSRIGNGGSYLKIGETLSALEVSHDKNAPSVKIFTSNTGANASGIEITPIVGSTAAGIKIGSSTGYEGRRGLEAYSDQRAVLGSSLNTVGGEFIGQTYSVDAHTRSAGVGTAVRGYNGDVGGDFTGGTTGMTANGGTYGITASSPSVAGLFSSSGGAVVYAGVGASAIYAFTGSASDYGLYTNGQIYTTANATVGGALNVTGDFDPSGNQWGGASSPTFDAKYGGAWPNLGAEIGWSSRGNRCGKFGGGVAPGSLWVCPDGSYMAGFQVDGAGKVINGVCCEL